MMFQHIWNAYVSLKKSRSPRTMSRYATIPRGYKPPIVVKPPKPLRRFCIQGYEVMAFSRKDAIKRLKHQKLI